jgi:lysophospholipase L1-like esterase
MGIIRKIEVFGDSILKGVQLNNEQRYCVDNHIDTEMLSRRFSLEISNRSRMGCTVTKVAALIERFIQGNTDCAAVVMDLGGNDCDFNWKEISDHPEVPHEPHTPVEHFEEAYHKIISKLKERGIVPILTTLPPLDPQRFFDWWCAKLNKDAILDWLGSIQAIYRFQENYSRIVERIADTASVPIVDIRGAFLRNRKIEHLLCDDGTHPNTEGQRVITEAFLEFGENYSFA